MSKRQRKVAFRDEVDIGDKRQREEEGEESRSVRKSRFKEKHSLDSDEEDTVDEVQLAGLDDEDLAAQEESTVTQDGDIKVTPFNLKEEMEEGYFDAHGNYYTKNDPDEIQDNWLSEFDWDKVEEQREWNEPAERKESRGDKEEATVNRADVYREILDILQPGETVLKAVKRLGGKSTQSASERWRKKKTGLSKNGTEDAATSSDGQTQTSAEGKAVIERLTGLADQLIAIGDYSVYEDSYERIKYTVERETKAREPVDMFADIDTTTESPPDAPPSEDEVKWEYRWENKEDTEIHGPFSSAQMSDWVESGYFPNGVWVRKAHTADAKFYNSQRIDFDIYT